MYTEPSRNKLLASGNGYVVVPKWFVSFLSFLSSVVFVGATYWAWSISADVSAIKAEVKAQSELRATELEDVRRQLDRHDQLLDRLLERREP
ncbi:MAG TPA: hypothetical protein EYP14_13690 [Planctomycetaceae bacterium]|nr:hypothetical protein [Planctomycetaceae bacterium]